MASHLSACFASIRKRQRTYRVSIIVYIFLYAYASVVCERRHFYRVVLSITADTDIDATSALGDKLHEV